MSGAKTNRIDLRVSQEQKDLLETAASLKGISLSAYLLAHCLEIAQADIAKHQKLVLSDRDRDLFLSLITNPPQPKQDLVEAMQQFQQDYEV
ncbi:MAG: DUF1778 domain-containing protein [Cyanobacteria bacterium P01_G01_bin.67]